MSAEEHIVAEARALFEQKSYPRLKAYISEQHVKCETDAAKLQLLHLWEDSLYLDFIESRGGSNNNGGSNGDNGKPALSSSMRYKLRKKFPCPIELEHELRVKNARLPKPVHDGLNAWLKRHKDNPYPNKAEKEGLSSRLGITPQQVNRWFIQRRKMLRIRGGLYLGRGNAENEGSGDEYNDEDYERMSQQQHHDDSSLSHQDNHNSQQTHLLYVPDGGAQRNPASDYANSSLLQKILTNSPGSSPTPTTAITSKDLCSGGSVEVLERSIRYRMLEMEGALPLTPPPSVSGDSNARATPPETTPTSHQDEALDLTVKDEEEEAAKPVILEQVLPSWRHEYLPQQLPFSYESSCSSSSRQQLEAAEMAAAETLLSLSKGH